MKACTANAATVVVCLSMFLAASPAQTTGSDATVPDSPSAAKQQQTLEERREIERKEQSTKILGVVPSYTVTTEKTALPMTPGEKFRLFARSTFNPFTFVAVGAQAGIGQATDSFPEYGQGAQGYGKRYGAALADQVVAGFFGNYAYPVIFHEDPRYFRSGEGTFSRRFWYAIGQEFVAHRDHGGKEFNFSTILGAGTSAAISNAYYPDSDRTAQDTFGRAAIAVGYGCIGNLGGEFWPDIHDKWLRRKQKKKADQPSQP